MEAVEDCTVRAVLSPFLKEDPQIYVQCIDQDGMFTDIVKNLPAIQIPVIWTCKLSGTSRISKKDELFELAELRL